MRMIMMKLATAFAFTALMFTAACGNGTQAPKAGTLNQKLRMVSDDGRYYGTVEFDPIRGGRIYDAQGQLIGDIVPVQQR